MVLIHRNINSIQLLQVKTSLNLYNSQKGDWGILNRQQALTVVMEMPRLLKARSFITSTKVCVVYTISEFIFHTSRLVFTQSYNDSNGSVVMNIISQKTCSTLGFPNCNQCNGCLLNAEFFKKQPDEISVFCFFAMILWICFLSVSFSCRELSCNFLKSTWIATENWGVFKNLRMKWWHHNLKQKY